MSRFNKKVDLINVDISTDVEINDLTLLKDPTRFIKEHLNCYSGYKTKVLHYITFYLYFIFNLISFN